MYIYLGLSFICICTYVSIYLLSSGFCLMLFKVKLKSYVLPLKNPWEIIAKMPSAEKIARSGKFLWEYCFKLEFLNIYIQLISTELIKSYLGFGLSLELRQPLVFVFSDILFCFSPSISLNGIFPFCITNCIIIKITNNIVEA